MILRETPVRTRTPVAFTDLWTVRAVCISLSDHIDYFATQLMANQWYWTERISHERLVQGSAVTPSFTSPERGCKRKRDVWAHTGPSRSVDQASKQTEYVLC